MKNDTRRENSPSPDNTADLLDQMFPELTSAAMNEAAKTAESIDTKRFAFNPWYPIPNCTLKGYTFGIQHYILDRMCLIPLKTWKTVVIQPRTGGFAVGSMTGAGAFPSGSVGSKVDQRLQFPAESAAALMAAYGKDSPNDIGMVMLDSLTATSDADTLESLLLFRAIMATPLDIEGVSERLMGKDLWLEALLDLGSLYGTAKWSKIDWLNRTAPKLLAQAIQNGVPMYASGTQSSSRPVRVVPLSPQAQAKGEALIEDMKRALRAAAVRALHPEMGVLPKTKKEMTASARGSKDMKNQTDNLDNWLLTQYVCFSLDTDVERANNANASLIEAIREGRSNEDGIAEFMALQRETLEQLKEANKANSELAQSNLALAEELRSRPPVNSESSTAS